ncbi:MAG: muconolactone Delta-isomerase family protein [Alphaproteobacteria bacterium]|jgi:muconolactone D-isomerase|nr:muconolactone delta-isomerase [Rhodospirillaceae bacterium]MBT7613134.1 muconolactone delta-isomerase [Rhodospirillaceae bacterium]MDG2483033.1 muconolactone Delta-isomerase family protein [Alphaproteobacteria bacterium]
MEFLVNINLRWPDDMGPDRRQEITVAERAHAAELIKLGHLKRMWRIPGQFANWGLWEAKDATEIHEILTSMPAYPYMAKVEVHPLAIHPVDPSPPAR